MRFHLKTQTLLRFRRPVHTKTMYRFRWKRKRSLEWKDLKTQQYRCRVDGSTGRKYLYVYIWYNRTRNMLEMQTNWKQLWFDLKAILRQKVTVLVAGRLLVIISKSTDAWSWCELSCNTNTPLLACRFRFGVKNKSHTVVCCLYSYW